MKEKKKLPSGEVSVFCEQVGMMLRAGIPLCDAVESLSDSYREPPYGEGFRAVSDALLERRSFFEALSEAGIFPSHMLGMVKVGELTGRLDDVMDSLAAYYSREARLNEGIRSAVAYPTVLMLLMGAVVAVLMICVMPVFSRVYNALGVSVDTGAGMAVGRAVLIVTAVALAALLLLALLLKTNRRSAALRFLKGLSPAVKRVDEALFASRFASVISTMLISGCDVASALEMSRGVATAEQTEVINGCLERLSAGGSLSDAVSKAGIFEPIHVKMMSVGARSGKLDAVMERIASIYSDKAERGMHDIVSAIEPTLAGLLCIAIGGILLSVMLPLLGILADMA